MHHLASLSHRRHRAGMTLLELLVVQSILALVACLIPLAMQRMLPSRRLAAAAHTLAVDLRDLQSEAAISGRPLRLTIEKAGYSLQQVGTDELRHVGWPADTEATLPANPEGPASHILVMYPDGSSSGGAVELGTQHRFAVVKVSAWTGRVRVSQ